MSDFIANITPPPLKRQFRRILNALARRTELKKRTDAAIQRIDSLERRLTLAEGELFELRPEIISCNSDTRKAASQVLRENKMPPTVNLAISKHDYMYQFLEKHCANASVAYLAYINSGAHMMDVLNVIAARKWGVFSQIPAFLDFASGYGRLTRFVVEALPPERVWVSDIKAGAVAFQKEQFGVNTILSTANPEDLKVPRRYDLIFVGSLFSHLPEATFAKWLQRLCDLLTEDGVIVFTVHDVSLLNAPSTTTENEIIFRPASEEGVLLSRDGRLAGNQYGTTHVNENYVRSVLQNLDFKAKGYSRYPKAMWECQDVYILSRNEKDDFLNLVLLPQRVVEG